MKAFVSAIAALAATASAKPYYGLGLGYGGYGLAAPYGYGLAGPLAAPLAPIAELKCKDPIWGLPVLCAAEEEAAAPAEEAKEKRSADAQLYGLGYGYGGYGLGYGGYGLGLPVVAPVELKCKDPWGLPALCPAEPEEAAKEKRSADAQIFGYGLPYGGIYGGYGLPLAPIELNCKNGFGFPVPCAAEGEADAAPAEEAAKEKRSADAQIYGLGYGGYGYGGLGYGLAAPYAVVPEVEGHPTGLIVSPGSGAVTPDFTDAQKEANPEIAEGSKSIDIPVVTGYTHVVGKREAEPYFYGGLGYGYGGLGYGLAAPILPAPVELNCKNAWGWPVLCAQEGEADAAPAEEAAKEKRSADAQLYLGGLAPWGLPGPLVHSSLLGVCTNVSGEQVPC